MAKAARTKNSRRAKNRAGEPGERSTSRGIRLESGGKVREKNRYWRILDVVERARKYGRRGEKKKKKKSLECIENRSQTKKKSDERRKICIEQRQEANQIAWRAECVGKCIVEK